LTLIVPKKILILYTSVGLGHKSIAENIGYHLGQAGFEVKLFDALQLQAGPLVSAWTWLHQFINRHLPFIWQWLYTHADRGWFAKLTLPNRVKAASRNYRHIKQAIDEFQPDLVIATQTSASAVVQYLKQRGWYKGLFAIAFSDYHLHRYWLYGAADFYWVNIEEQKQEMARLGIPAEKIFVLGMTLPPRLPVDIAAVKQKLGIAPDERVVLVASGSLGTGLPVRWFATLAKQIAELPKTRLVIVCGKNRALYEALNRLNLPGTIVQGYYSPLAELYAISNIFLTKPGGLTIAETLQWHLPVLVTHWLPGGEELNYNYLAARCLILPKSETTGFASIVPVISVELAAGKFRESLISNSHSIQLTQAGHEGQALVLAVKKAFHDV
jgi:processive 1,2-diacylglycerol beta-glucosyltransferase